ncbi:MAG: hypothetical protein QGD89_01140 [Actinomycetota bacterium]|nr:hypothetical protein [Actinomycetota bacterium]
MSITWDERDQLLTEVVMGTPRSKSKVPPSEEVDALRRELVREVREMKADGIMPEPLKD